APPTAATARARSRCPILRGRVPVHQGPARRRGSYVLGASGGVEIATVATAQIPGHDHTVQASPNPGSQAGAGEIIEGSAPSSLARWVPRSCDGD
ncbi:MAG: hypothetical protein M3071_00995, partial [Actinomycetota bacterium]|nr:hypothetical protein [Actinomycetota bacterium]